MENMDMMLLQTLAVAVEEVLHQIKVLMIKIMTEVMEVLV